MKIMKRLLSFMALTLLLGLSVGMPVAKAHVLQTNNGVSAILHIKPDDNPVAAILTDVNFLFSATSGGFSLRNYNVMVKIAEDGVVKYSGSVAPAYFGSSSEGSATVTFPKAAVYDIVVTGQPISPDIPAFKLDYIVRVTGGSAALASQKGDPTPAIVIGVIAGACLVMVAVKNITSGGRYRPVASAAKG